MAVLVDHINVVLEDVLGDRPNRQDDLAVQAGLSGSIAGAIWRSSVARALTTRISAAVNRDRPGSTVRVMPMLMGSGQGHTLV